MRKLNLLLVIATALLFSACKKIGLDGGTRTDVMNTAEVTTFTHPGILHNQNDLNRIKSLVAGGGYPSYGSYLIMKNKPTAASTYQMKGPYVKIARDGADGGTASGFQQDFTAAYQNALQWVITGNEAYAIKSVEILNAYSNTLTGITGSNDNALTASLGGFILANAAEIMRYTYPAWSSTDVAKCEAMFRNVFVKEMNTFYATPAYTNGNWGASVIKSMMAIGIFLNDRAIFNQAVDFFYSVNIDNGSIANYIINETGQCQESGRDQGHVWLGLNCLAEACEVGYKQNLDMFGALNNRLLAGYEYSAKYNLGNDVPYIKWADVTGKYSNWAVISAIGRGILGPSEIVYNHYVTRKQLTMPYTQQLLGQNRPEGAAGGVDGTGYGSLLYYLGTSQSPDPYPGFFNHQFNTDGNKERWSSIQAGSSTSVSAGKLNVNMANLGTAAAPVYRADITISRVNVDPVNYPIWAIHFNKPGNSNLTLNNSMNTLAGKGTLLSSNDGINTYYWDLKTKFTELTLLDALTLKVADQTTGAPNYQVDWIMTFKTVDDLKAYLASL